MGCNTGAKLSGYHGPDIPDNSTAAFHSCTAVTSLAHYCCNYKDICCRPFIFGLLVYSLEKRERKELRHGGVRR